MQRGSALTGTAEAGVKVSLSLDGSIVAVSVPLDDASGRVRSRLRRHVWFLQAGD